MGARKGTVMLAGELIARLQRLSPDQEVRLCVADYNGYERFADLKHLVASSLEEDGTAYLQNHPPNYQETEL